MPDNNKPYAFFVSYCHSDDPDIQSFNRTFFNALEFQVRLHLRDAGGFFDEEEMAAGDDLENKLAYKLCRSAAMVMIYNPSYFDIYHPWCAREYQAMLTLEKERAIHVGPHNKLVIPVIIRGFKDMPEVIKNHTLCAVFEEHVTDEKDFKKTKCRELIKKIAEGIVDRYKALHNAGVFSAGNCKCAEFAFPSEESIKDWLGDIAPLKYQPPIPGH